MGEYADYGENSLMEMLYDEEYWEDYSSYDPMDGAYIRYRKPSAQEVFSKYRAPALSDQIPDKLE